MSQDRLIKLVSQGDPKTGEGKGHVYYSFKNKKLVQRKLEYKKFNPLIRKYTIYKETKK
jgi:large subunit ribosomal protein L33